MWARIFIFNQSKSFRLNVVSFAFSFPEAMHWLYIKTFRPAIFTNQIDSNLTVHSFHIKYEANLWWLLLTSRCWLVEFIEMKRSCDCLNNIVFCSNRDQQFLPIRSIARNIWSFTDHQNTSWSTGHFFTETKPTSRSLQQPFHCNSPFIAATVSLARRS